MGACLQKGRYITVGLIWFIVKYIIEVMGISNFLCHVHENLQMSGVFRENHSNRKNNLSGVFTTYFIDRL